MKLGWHISAKKGEVAERVLLPGDPLRAKHIAETFLDDAHEYSHIRNMLGFTGTYKGVPVSVQGTGMGMPSIAIYVNELIREYGAKKLIRTGTCGALQKDVRVRDLVIAQATTTDSSMVENMFPKNIHFAPVGSMELIEKAEAAARAIGAPYHTGNVLSQDRLFDDEIDLKMLAEHGVLGAEMETCALYLIAARLKVEALGIFTVSNHIITGEETTPEERETSFNDMAKVALDAIIK